MEITASMQELKSVDIWMGHTGASNHCTFSTEGMYNLEYKPVATMSATGAANNETKSGDINVKACNKNGIEYTDFTMEGVNYSPAYNFNLFSISKSLSKGWKLSGNAQCITLTSPSDESKIVFDIVIPTAQGCIFVTMLVRNTKITAANVKTDKQKKDTSRTPTMTLQEAHAKLGHCDKEKVIRTAKTMGWRLLTSQMHPCEACAMGKAKQKRYQKLVPE